MFHEIPFELRMRVEGREFRKELLKLKLLDGDEWPTYMQMRLEQIDEWFVNHGIDPETIQLTHEDLEEVKKEKEMRETLEKEWREERRQRRKAAREKRKQELALSEKKEASEKE